MLNTKELNAQTVILNGAVYTVDKKNTICRALCIKDKKIIFVGEEEEAKKYINEDTKVIDLNGGIVFPGFIDSHMHPAIGAVPYLYEISLIGIYGKDNCLEIIRDFVLNNPDMEIHTGLGYATGDYDENGPRKEWLDEISPNKPMMITSSCGHAMWVNSKALEMANITKDTVSPDGGRVAKDKNTGEPSGALQGVSAIKLVEHMIPQYTKEQYKKAILWLQEWFNKEGLTTVYDAYLDLTTPNINDAYNELANEGLLTMRFRGGWHVYPGIGTEDEIENYIKKSVETAKNYKTPYFQVNSFKLCLDGVTENETAYFIEPYSHRDDDYRGVPTWEAERLKSLMTRLDKEKFQIHMHQIGDATAKEALDALEYAKAENGERDSRHVFAHVQFIREEDEDRMSKLKMSASMAPYWTCYDPVTMQETYYPYVGEERANNMWRIKSLIDKGINVGVNCDFYVTEPDMGSMLYSGITRAYCEKVKSAYYGEEYVRTIDPDIENGEYTCGVLSPANQRLTLEELIKMNTINGAYANFMEDEIGSIEVGKYADLVIYDENLLEIDLESLSEVKPRFTIFDGKIVYEKTQELLEEEM